MSHSPDAAGPPLPERVPGPLRGACERTVAELQDHFARDRLSLEEFEARVGAAYQATSREALGQLTADLPARADRGAPVPERVPSVPERLQLIARSADWGGPLIVPSHLEIRAVAGNLKLDLSRARFRRGVTEIDLRLVLSNLEIRLPAAARVESEVRIVLGGLRDHPQGDGGRRLPSGERDCLVRLSGRGVLSNVTLVRE